MPMLLDGQPFRKFLYAVDEALIKDYFKSINKPISDSPGFWDDNVKTFLENLPEPERLGILEDFEIINEVAKKMDCIVRATQATGIPVLPAVPNERNAMGLFVHYPDTFRMARDYYLCFTLEADVTYCQMPPESNANFDPAKINNLKTEIAAHFQFLHKGPNCSVRHYFEENKHYILVERGDYIKTDMEWKDGENKTKPIFYRPGKEDVLVYNPDNKVLGIRLSGKGADTKKKYVELFGTHILGQAQLPDSVHKTALVSLEPFSTGKFSYKGNAVIREIKLIGLEGAIL